MKKLLSAIAVLALLFVTFFQQPAQAADLANGAKVFDANCAACHAGGKNMIMTSKTLKKEALEQYGMNSVEAIVKQVTNGKSAMPAFLGRLNNAQIEDVAGYVLDQASKGWS